MAETDDRVEAIEIELLDGQRKEREIVAIEPPDERQMLDERGVRPQAFDRRGNRPADVNQREELGVRKPLAQHFERLLAAAHAGQPVVHERQAH
jgi:hypothetical protein